MPGKPQPHRTPGLQPLASGRRQGEAAEQAGLGHCARDGDGAAFHVFPGQQGGLSHAHRAHHTITISTTRAASRGLAAASIVLIGSALSTAAHLTAPERAGRSLRRARSAECRGGKLYNEYRQPFRGRDERELHCSATDLLR